MSYEQLRVRVRLLYVHKEEGGLNFRRSFVLGIAIRVRVRLLYIPKEDWKEV